MLVNEVSHLIFKTAASKNDFDNVFKKFPN